MGGLKSVLFKLMLTFSASTCLKILATWGQLFSPFLFDISVSQSLTYFSRVENELARLAGHDVAGASEQVHCPRVCIVVVNVYEADL